MKSFMKSVICFLFGDINSKKDEDGQTGTNKALFPLQSFK